MSVISLYAVLPKNSCFVTKKYFCQYFPIFGQLYIELSFLVIHGNSMIESSGLVQILTENKFSMIGLDTHWKLLYVQFLLNFVRLHLSVKPICCHMIGLQKNRKIIHRFCSESVTDLQIKVLMYIRSICEANFKLHVEVL